MTFNYDDIDLYYYHSTDVDFPRIDSILKYGVLSANKIKENNIPYYHRNYRCASCMNDFISISQFSRSIWHHYHIKNELYDASAQKVVFIINGYINSLVKQSHRNKNKFTTELHVRDEIKKEDIFGIVIRECDIEKFIKNIPFKMDYTHFDDLIKKCFDVINFFKDKYNLEFNHNDLYFLIGKLMEERSYKREEYKIILSNIGLYMQNYINEAYKIILNKEEPTLKDVLVSEYNIPIYVMTKYDIKPISEQNELIRTEGEFREENLKKLTLQ